MILFAFAFKMIFHCIKDDFPLFIFLIGPSSNIILCVTVRCLTYQLALNNYVIASREYNYHKIQIHNVRDQTLCHAFYHC